MKKCNKAQITIFIILAIGLVLISVIIYLNKGKLIPVDKDPEILKISEYIQSCLELESKNSLLLFGLSGGKINSQRTFNLNDSNISYLYYAPESYFNSLSQMENELGKFFDLNFDNCFNDFSGLKDEGYNIKFNELGSEVDLKESVKFEVDFSLEITKGESAYQLKDKYYNEIPVRFDLYYDLVDNIISQQKKGPEIDIVDLLDSGLNVTVAKEDDTLIYLLEDDDSQLNDETYIFVFAVGRN